MSELIEIKVDDISVVKMLGTLVNRLGDMSPIMRPIAGTMHDAVEENFAQEGRPKWEPLAKSTIKSRKDYGYWPGKILQQRGSLASTIFAKYSSNAAVVGTNKEYAARMQFGYEGGSGRGQAKTPARPFLMLPPDAIEDIKDMLTKEMMKGI